MSKRNQDLCHGCDACCRYVAIEIDKPTNQSDRDHIFWYLFHANTNVFVDWDDNWFVEFVAPCNALDKKTKLCRVYENRPQVCRKHSQDDCVKYGDGPAEKHYFRTPADYEKFLKRKK